MEINTIGNMIQDMRNGVYDYTKDGECSRCGQCCSNYLPVSVKEANRIWDYIHRNNIRECVHRPPTAKPTIDMTCPFRDDAKQVCTIYEVRPLICRDFRCDNPKKKIEADKRLYNGKYGVLDMRETFYPKKNKL